MSTASADPQDTPLPFPLPAAHGDRRTGPCPSGQEAPAVPRAASASRMTRPLIALFAVAGGAAVGSRCWTSSPGACMSARRPPGCWAAGLLGCWAAGLLVTATQLGYAADIFLIVPSGDIRDRRRLIPL
jgi:hypothetical protein